MKKNLFSMVVLVSAFYGLIYLSGLYWWLEFLVSVLAYSVVFYLWHTAISYLRKKERMTIKKFLPYFAYRLSTFLIVIFVLFWSFVYYENKIEPAKLPEFTVTNGKKTVVFQWMAHIWSDAFYKQVQDNIRQRKKEWYVYFYEWVKLGKKENMEKFDKLLGVKFDKKTYVNLSKIYWLRAQDNNDFFWIENDLDFNADIWMDEIISLYEKKYWAVDMTKKTQDPKISADPVSVDKIIESAISQMTPRELNFLIYVNRSIMNFIIKNESVRNTILAWSGQKNLFDIILEDRNRVIIDSIVKTEHPKIYITYWLMHFNGVWSWLQRLDPSWKLLSIKYLTPIE
ncbi:MAG: hypothetical protein ACD_2C00135G0001 [uncultured bacterium (gcode 4)]|uniref:Uncharacterized protein n=1 Tax=uncultured bacterium (gcode 4) TaxID=1234023 RepID=K2H1B0_9BACT|nr:MAG: hypothetical protein ACD_2C00135G0001 [uncultured bacterium (gcode 4)]